MPHLARDAAVQLGDAVAVRRKAQRERCQPEPFGVGAAPEIEQAVVGDPRAPREVADVAQHEVVAEHLVPGRHRRVRREDRCAANLFERVVGRRAGLDEHAGALDHEEGRVALVDVVHARRDPERVQRAHAADAEQELLPNPMLPIAGVQRIGHPRHVEQVERHRADVVAPDGGVDDLAAEIDLDLDGLADEPELLGVELLVALGLPALVGDALDEIAAAVEEPDRNERHTELGSRLQVVAGEDAEAAGVDREARVDAELHAEVGDEDVAVIRMRLRPPRGGFVDRSAHKPPRKLAKATGGA